MAVKDKILYEILTVHLKWSIYYVCENGFFSRISHCLTHRILL